MSNLGTKLEPKKTSHQSVKLLDGRVVSVDAIVTEPGRKEHPEHISKVLNDDRYKLYLYSDPGFHLTKLQDGIRIAMNQPSTIGLEPVRNMAAASGMRCFEPDDKLELTEPMCCDRYGKPLDPSSWSEEDIRRALPGGICELCNQPYLPSTWCHGRRMVKKDYEQCLERGRLQRRARELEDLIENAGRQFTTRKGVNLELMSAGGRLVSLVGRIEETAKEVRKAVLNGNTAKAKELESAVARLQDELAKTEARVATLKAELTVLSVEVDKLPSYEAEHAALRKTLSRVGGLYTPVYAPDTAGVVRLVKTAAAVAQEARVEYYTPERLAKRGLTQVPARTSRSVWKNHMTRQIMCNYFFISDFGTYIFRNVDYDEWPGANDRTKHSALAMALFVNSFKMSETLNPLPSDVIVSIASFFWRVSFVGQFSLMF